MYGRDDHVKN
jgi:hypothetical protein